MKWFQFIIDSYKNSVNEIWMVLVGFSLVFTFLLTTISFVTMSINPYAFRAWIVLMIINAIPLLVYYRKLNKELLNEK